MRRTVRAARLSVSPLIIASYAAPPVTALEPGDAATPTPPSTTFLRQCALDTPAERTCQALLRRPSSRSDASASSEIRKR